MNHTNIELPKRYWDKVNKETSPCWLWTAARNDAGYGVIGSKTLTGRQYEYAHRLMFWHHGGVLADGEVVDHTCGNGHLGCVTPTHLRAIPRVINNAQGRIKSRRPTCPKCGEKRDTNSLGNHICRPCEALYQKQYLEHNRDKINRAKRDRNARKRRESGVEPRLTDETALLIIAAKGTRQEVAERFGVTGSTVYKLKTGRSRPHLTGSGD